MIQQYNNFQLDLEIKNLIEQIEQLEHDELFEKKKKSKEKGTGQLTIGRNKDSGKIELKGSIPKKIRLVRDLLKKLFFKKKNLKKKGKNTSAIDLQIKKAKGKL